MGSSRISHRTCLEFLLTLFKKGLSYSALNTSRSSLSCIFDEPAIGENPKITRFMRSVFLKRPPKPRYTEMWDVSKVLKFLEKWSPSKDLSLKNLTLKVVTLCALLTGQRCQTLHSFKINECQISPTKATFYISDILKHDSPHFKQAPIVLPSYPEDKRLCIVTYIKKYIERTKPFRTSSQLFISFTKPHKPVCRNTVSRWIKCTLQKAGINTSIYKTHSTRSASTSAVQRDVDITTILKTAGWRNSSTFAKYYMKPIN